MRIWGFFGDSNKGGLTLGMRNGGPSRIILSGMNGYLARNGLLGDKEVPEFFSIFKGL